MRRTAPLWAVIAGVVALMTWYVIYMHSVVTDLRIEASHVGTMYARVYDALGNSNPDAATAALQDLSRTIRESGVPIIITDAKGNVSTSANLPRSILTDPIKVRDYTAELRRENKPISEPAIGT
ncbi:MAG TPA: hypothetical protein VNU46_09795, partial [Gemmatimonadaceae bacterium]|nr:hypothetical protein [Gemmatimonadaceae bacterium]